MIIEDKLLLCSHSPYDVPPEPQRNVSIAAVRGAERPSKLRINKAFNALYRNLATKSAKIFKPDLSIQEISGEYSCALIWNVSYQCASSHVKLQIKGHCNFER